MSVLWGDNLRINKLLAKKHCPTGYWVLVIVYLDQLLGARHTHISYHD